MSRTQNLAQPTIYPVLGDIPYSAEVMKIIFPWTWDTPNPFTKAGIDLILFTGSIDLDDPNIKPAIIYPSFSLPSSQYGLFYIEYDNKIFEMLTNFNPRHFSAHPEDHVRDWAGIERIVPHNTEDAHILKLVKETANIRHRLHSLSQQSLAYR
jgi:hypothetical protein